MSATPSWGIYYQRPHCEGEFVSCAGLVGRFRGVLGTVWVGGIGRQRDAALRELENATGLVEIVELVPALAVWIQGIVFEIQVSI